MAISRFPKDGPAWSAAGPEGGGPLAPERTPFFGRERERRKLIEEVLAAKNRVLTITGPSGMGKTRLARVLVDSLDQSFHQGQIWFCDLGHCRSATDVEAAVAEAAGLIVQGPGLIRGLAGRGRVLIVLDNLDHAVRVAAPLIEAWFDGCPEAIFLVTSILPLSIDIEVRFELGPLEEQDAIDLYLDRAHRAWADRGLAAGERELVGELVARLDRIPLALELAAARVRVLPPKALLSRMGSRFEILQSRRGGRHGSLARAIALTWELLSPEEQWALAKLSVFEGGFILDAALELLEGDEAEGIERIDLLRSRALIQLDPCTSRLSVLESVREFASKELERLGQRQELETRHARYFAKRGGEEALALGGRQAPEALRWLRIERGNLLAALRRMRERQPGLAARAGLALTPLLSLEGLRASEADLADRTLEAARASGEPLLLLQALRSMINGIIRFGRQEEALAYIEEGLELAAREAAEEERGFLLIAKATLCLRGGSIDRASAHLEEAVAIGRSGGGSLLEGIALQYLAALSRYRCDLDRAAELYQEALRGLRINGHLRQEGATLGNYAVVLTEQGRYRKARLVLEEALRIARELESPGLEASALVNLSGVELAAGELEGAAALAKRALAKDQVAGNLRFEAIAEGNLGLIALELGEKEEGERRLLRAVGLLQESGDQRLQSTWLQFLAAAQALLGRAREAREALDEARSFFTEAGDAANLEVCEILSSLVGLCAAEDGGAADQGELRAEAVERYEATAAGKTNVIGDARIAGRLLAKVLKRSEAAPDEERLLVGPDGAWFELGAEERVDLRRRGAARRIFAALVMQREVAPGEGLSKQEVFDIGWEGSRADPPSAATRVYNEIRILRSLGLAGILLNHASGYLLDPALPIARSP